MDNSKLKTRLFALVDCNNFYASCERVFNPNLRNKPIVVLSNNDGIIIARSQEAKELGIQMGAPLFKTQAHIDKHNVYVFSSNFTLYGDMSNRVMRILHRFSPEVEIYSIDEAFLSLINLKLDTSTRYCTHIRETVRQWTGIPISIGIAPTKTLAKAANKLAKKIPELNGILDLTDHPKINELLNQLSVSDIWGIGRKYAKFLQSHNIHTAMQLKNASDKWIQKHMTISGLRTIWELRGISCINLEDDTQPRKGILSSRSFSHPVETLNELKESVAKHTTIAAEKLRSQNSSAAQISVFITTNRFNNSPQYSNSATVSLSEATDYTPKLIEYSHKALEKIFKPGYLYKKAGVMIPQTIPSDSTQKNLLTPCSENTYHTNKKIMETIDRLNLRWGRATIKTAAEGIKQEWKTKMEKRTPRYTTRWDEIPIAKC
ncbi:Y-family DNA polymerase [Candidatus Dojkabacteria bacterium]|nr:Y-family DNA polymerase [Candidatus Dojkabacteria bacterium]